MQLSDFKIKRSVPFSVMKCNHVCVFGFICILKASVVFASEPAVSVPDTVVADKVNKYLTREDFPPEFYVLLSNGLEVPFLVRTAAGAEVAGKAMLRHTGEFLTLDGLTFASSKLTPEYKKLFEQQYGKPVSHAECAALPTVNPADATGVENTVAPANLSLCFDVMRFELMASLPESAYLKQSQTRTNILAESTENTVSGLVNYNASLMQFNHQDPDGYLNVKSLTSYGVNYLTLDADIRSSQPGQINEAQITRDVNGFNISAGYLGPWSMSKLGRMSYAGGGKFVGVTGGNKGRSMQIDSSLSQTPVFVYMPASGQVSIYRDGKLINVQQLPLGNQEIDTRPLPAGNYPVRVDAIVNGKVVSSKEEMIYKTTTTLDAEQSFQVFGGRFEQNYGDPTYLVGTSTQLRTAWVDLDASLYSYGSDVAFEPGFQKTFSNGSINGQVGISTDGGRNASLGGSLNLGGGSVWGRYDYARLSVLNGLLSYRKNINLGASLNLARLLNLEYSPQINVSISEDLVNISRNTRLDFSQSLYRNRWMDARLTAGKNWQSQSGGYYSNINSGLSSNSQSYFIGVNFNFSFGSGGIDYSRSLETETMGVNANWRPADIDGLDSLGATLSRSRSISNSYADPTTNVAVRASGKNRIFGWDGSLSNNSSNGGIDVMGNMNGGLGWNKGGVGMANSQSDAGVLIKLDAESRGKLDLMVGGTSHLLENSTSFVPVKAFSQKTMTVRSSAKSPENYDIQEAEKDFVLYPGNVGLLQPKLKRLVTVFGVLVENGEPKPGVVLRNHIGTATTDAAGAFSVDVDTANPNVTYDRTANETCQIDFDLSKAKGALWVDEVTCMPLNIASI